MSGDIAAFLAGNLTAGGSLGSSVPGLGSTTAASVAATSAKAANASTVTRSSIGRLGTLTNLVVDSVTLLKLMIFLQSGPDFEGLIYLFVDSFTNILIDRVLHSAALLLVDSLTHLNGLIEIEFEETK